VVLSHLFLNLHKIVRFDQNQSLCSSIIILVKLDATEPFRHQIMIVFYIYLLIGLSWFLIISMYNWREFHGLKFLVGIIAYPLLFPFFFFLQLKKVSVFKKTLKGFNTFKFLLFNDYGTESSTFVSKQESNHDFSKFDDDLPPF